jgi:hypothetical protein
LLSVLLGVVLAGAFAASSGATPSTQYGEVTRFGGYDLAHAQNNWQGTPTPGLFVDVTGFASDTQDSTGGPDHTALYVADRTSAIGIGPASYRIQKLSDTGAVLGSTTFTLPDASANADALTAIAVDHAAGRVYGLVSGAPGGIIGTASVAVLAWSINPVSGALVAASGLPSDTQLHTTGALVSSKSQLLPAAPAGVQADLWLPQGFVVDNAAKGSAATAPLAIQALPYNIDQQQQGTR